MLSGVSGCPFCEILASREGEVRRLGRAAAFADRFPLAEGHVLVVPARHVVRLDELEAAEWADVFDLARLVASELGGDADGFNIGANVGEAAGQTVDHAHVHVIPRAVGDTDDPRGGVRWVLPEKARYWSDR